MPAGTRRRSQGQARRAPSALSAGKVGAGLAAAAASPAGREPGSQPSLTCRLCAESRTDGGKLKKKRGLWLVSQKAWGHKGGGSGVWSKGAPKNSSASPMLCEHVGASLGELSPIHHPAQHRSPNPGRVPLQESLKDGAGSCLQPQPQHPSLSSRPMVHDEFLIVSSNNETSCSEPGGSTKPDHVGEQGPFLLSRSGAMPSAPRHEQGDGKLHRPLLITPST